MRTIWDILDVRTIWDILDVRTTWDILDVRTVWDIPEGFGTQETLLTLPCRSTCSR